MNIRTKKTSSSPKMSTRRKLAIATWSPPHEGNMYGKLTVDISAALAYIEKIKSESNEKISVTHLVGKAVAQALRQAPFLNGYIRFGKYIPHPTVDITFLVAVDGTKDLAKAKISEVDRKSLPEIARDLQSRVERLRKGKDEDFEKSKGLLRLLPTWLLRPLVHTVGFLTSSLGINIKSLGLEAFPFGSCIITSIGMFGLDEGYVPPTPWARVPIYVLIGAIREIPAVVDSKIVIRKQMTLTTTLDHRFIDGFEAAILAQIVRSSLENPEQLEC